MASVDRVVHTGSTTMRVDMDYGQATGVELWNIHSLDSIDTESSSTRGWSIWVHSSQVGTYKWLCHVVSMNGSILLLWSGLAQEQRRRLRPSSLSSLTYVAGWTSYGNSWRPPTTTWTTRLTGSGPTMSVRNASRPRLRRPKSTSSSAGRSRANRGHDSLAPGHARVTE